MRTDTVTGIAGNVMVVVLTLTGFVLLSWALLDWVAYTHFVASVVWRQGG